MAEWSWALGHKAKRLVLHCINAVSLNPVEGRTQICQLKYLILTLLDYIYTKVIIFLLLLRKFEISFKL